MNAACGHVPLSRRWVREVDRRAIEQYGISGLVLMENAARGAVDVLLSLGCRGPVAIVCGKGNNAGDGFAMARHLRNRGISAKVLLADEPAKLNGDAAANYAILEKSGWPGVVLDRGNDTALARECGECEWIVDALLGTGSTGDPRPPLDRIIDQLNEAPGRKLAVDVPSGLDCDTGLPGKPTFCADHTVTFVATKPGFSVPAAQPYVGQVHLVDIGVPRVLVEQIVRDARRDAQP